MPFTPSANQLEIPPTSKATAGIPHDGGLETDQTERLRPHTRHRHQTRGGERGLTCPVRPPNP